MLSSLSPKIIEAMLPEVIKGFIAKFSEGMEAGDLIAQLRGDAEPSSFLKDAGRLLNHLGSRPKMMQYIASFGLSSAKEQGIPEKDVMTMATKFASAVGVPLDPSLPSNVALAQSLSELGTRLAPPSESLGAVCVCPLCSFAFIL